MSDRVHYKGRFIKQKVLKKRLKAVAAMTEAKKHRNKHERVGTRIVEVDELAKNLTCCMCQKNISLKNIVTESRFGLNSVFLIKCQDCSTFTNVSTGKRHKSKDGVTCSDVNTKIALGAVHAGVGYSCLNKILACLDIPVISSSLFKRYEREVGTVIEDAAKDSCKRAAEEERRLVVENVEKLCEELPEKISQEIYDEFISLKAALQADESSTSLHPDCISSNSALLVSTSTSSEHLKNFTLKFLKFDAVIGNIINIIVSYDMGWSKRGNGRSYDSLNGYGAIIGFLSGKVLDFRTRNRKCKFCSLGRNPDDHDCRLNFQGSAKAMEADVGAELINDSAILKEVGLNVGVVIGDEDTLMIAAVRRQRQKKIFKLADSNHLKKNFSKELYELQKEFKEMRKRTVMPHLKKCFNYAVTQNKGNSVKLASTLTAIPDHVFGSHENCGTWCQHHPDRLKDNKKQTILLEDQKLYTSLKKIFSKYAANSTKFSMAASSQGNESLNNIMAHKAPKNKCYSLSESSDYRWASAVCAKNEGEQYLSVVKTKLNLSPGKNTRSFALCQDQQRERRAAVSKMHSTKCRRNLLKQEREKLRKKKENTEGIQYLSNCGFDIDVNNNEDIKNDEGIEVNEGNVDAYNIVFFDIETSGFASSADILQLAAKTERRTFSQYIKPTQAIVSAASAVTGLKAIGNELYLHDTKVTTISLKEALEKFREFLSVSSKPSVLVAHNAKFDAKHLVQAIIRSDMIDDFKSIIKGFSDTLILFQKQFPDRKGKGLFKLSQLAKDLLPDRKNDNFHEAMFDVEILEDLVSSNIATKDLINNAKGFKKIVNDVLGAHQIAQIAGTLDGFNNTVSDGIIKKMATAKLSYNNLREIFIEKGEVGLSNFLSEKVNGKPRLTNRLKIINNIVMFFKNNS